MVTTVCFLDDIETAFREVRRVVKPGGLFLLGFVDKDSAIGRAYQERRQESLFYREAVFYSVRELTDLLRAAGFHDFRCRQTLFGPLSELWDVDEVREGHGEGSFVAIAAR
jgi:SAM-dependent methyltransferase